MVQSSKIPRNRHGVLLGVGRSNLAAARVLLDFGWQFTAFSEGALSDAPKKELSRLGIPLTEGVFPPRFSEEVLLRSPGVRPDLPPILASVKAGAALTSDTELFFDFTDAAVIGVTGSDGKTTTATLTAALLKGAGKKVILGGNNGTPLLPLLPEVGKGDVAVAELSSFQLMTLQKPPHTAVLTNLTPNHLNWHKDMAEYVQSKARLFQGCARAVLPLENAFATAFSAAGKRETVYISDEDTPALSACPRFVTVRENRIFCHMGKTACSFDVLGDFSLLGRHNLQNLLTATAAALPWLRAETLGETLRRFHGVPHRLETVAAVGGVTYINSSIDTSPTRTAAALSAVKGNPIVIAGGRGKGIPLAPLGDSLAARAKAVFCYGETEDEIVAALRGRVPATCCGRFADAFKKASRFAKKGDTVLLSPGCTAFGEFRDFEERGLAFRRLVKGLLEERKNH